MGEFNWKIGARKVGKNMLVMFLIPAILYGLSQIEILVPQEWLPIAIPLTSAASYAIKNYVENS
jgi:ABC-type transport system involved in cytochrome c biogenesis permease component